MVDTVRTEAALQALLADNTAGDISPQDVRDMLVSTWTPGWVRALDHRLPGETAHSDDQFFKDTLGGTVVTGTGTATWLQNYGRLSLKANGQGTTDLAALVYPITSAAAPMTIETHVVEGVQVGDQAPAVVLGFSNGAVGSSNIFGLFNYTNGYYGITLTFEGIGFTTFAAGGQPVTARYMRVCWVSANTFSFAISYDGISWTKRGSTTTAYTMTPTHFFVAGQQNPATDAIVGFDYIRVADSDLVG